MAHVRRGGHARNPAGDLITWSEAEGERGTRWRESIERDGRLVRSLLLEASTDARPTRLEITTRAGLLTLHPEPDQSALHGNVVTSDGIRHLAFPWSPKHELFIVASPASATIAIRRFARSVVVGAAVDVDFVYVDDELEPRPARWRAERTGPQAWHLQDVDGSEERRLTVADDGRPILLDEDFWPLEV
ncbi:MAG: hypothetical protein ACJ77D_01035 [Chloroflexota bacterium]